MSNLLLKRIKDWATSITAFRTGDVIPVDGPSGTAKMSKDDLLQLTSQNALAGGVAPAFDPTRTSEDHYNAGERVTYEGETYIFKVPHYGAWVAIDAYKAGLQVKQFDPSYFEVGRFDFTNSKYQSGNYRVRSRIGFSLPMKKGDKVICIDTTNCYFWYEATDSSGTKTYSSLPVASYTAAGDETLVLQLGYKNTDPIVDYTDLVRRFVFVGLSLPEEFVSNLVKGQDFSLRSLPSECFVSGVSVNVSSGNMVVNSGSAVLCSEIHLKAGDFVQLESDSHQRVGIRKIYDDGSTPAGVSLGNGILYIEKDCKCLFEFMPQSGYSLSVDDIAANFRIYTKDSGTSKFLATITKNSGLAIQKLTSELFHFGYSGVYDGTYGVTYTGFTSLASDYLAFVSLKANDVIRVTDERYKFRVVGAVKGGNASQSSYATAFYIVPSDQDCWILITRVDGAAMTDEEFLNVPTCIEIFSLLSSRNAEIRSAVSAAVSRRKLFEAHPGKIRLTAHRGETGLAPENTLPAFIAAKMNGYDYIETDVQFTSDGVPVILHDETVDRTSDGTGKLYELTYAQVRELDFGSWMNTRFAGTKIPTLEETLQCCKDIGLGIYLEFKPFGPYDFDSTETEAIIKLVEKYGMMDNVVFVGDPTTIHTLRPKASICLGGSAIIQPSIVSTALAVKDDNDVEVLGQIDQTFDADVVAALVEGGVKIGTWTSASQSSVAVVKTAPKCCEMIMTNTVNARGLFTNMTLHGWS